MREFELLNFELLKHIKSLRWKVAQAAEIRWWQHYLKNRTKADYLLWKKQYWLALLKELDIEIIASAQILDAGCGPAGIFMALNDAQIDAVDPLLEQYQQRLPHFEKADYPHVNFFSTSLEDFTMAKKYGVIFCLNAINHVADLDRCLDKLVEGIKKGGALVLSIDAHNFSFFKYLFRWLPGDILHPHQYDLEEYKMMLEKRGLNIRQCLHYKKGFFFDYYVLAATPKY